MLINGIIPATQFFIPMGIQVLLLIGALSFAATFFAVKIIIRKTLKKKYHEWDRGFVVPDMARKGKPLVPRIGGLGLLAGFTLGALIAIRFVPYSQLVVLFAVLCMVLIIGMLAFFSDLIPMRQRTRMLFPALAAIPLMAISAGYHTMTIPLIGAVEFGIIYPLLLVPIAVMAVSNLFNMLAGHNGLEAGTVLIVALTLMTAFILKGQAISTNPIIVPMLLLASLIGACLAFLYFNWYPARVFPGDVGTYTMAAVIIGVVITGNIEQVGIIAVMPQIAEFFLKIRTWFRAENFGTLRNGRLYYNKKISSLTHIIMKYMHPTEQQLTLILIGIQALFGALAVASLYMV